MKEVLELLDKLLPLSITVVIILFGYLAILYKKILESRIDHGEKDKLDLIKKIDVTVRLSELYEKEIGILTRKVKDLERDYSRLNISIESNEVNQDSRVNSIYQSPNHKQIVTINLAELPNFAELLEKFHNYGLNTCSIRKNSDDDLQPSFIEIEQQSIWIGGQIPAATAILALKMAKNHWPFLKYVYLTTDLKNVKKEIHSILFVGGNTRTALTLNLNEWSDADFDELNLNWTQFAFHSYIREKSDLNNLEAPTANTRG